MRNDASGSLEEERETGEEDTVIMVNNTEKMQSREDTVSMAQ